MAERQRDRLVDEHLAAWRAEEDVRPADDLALRAWTHAVSERRRAETNPSPWARIERALRPRMLRLRVTPAVGLAAAATLVAAALVGRAAMAPAPSGDDGPVASNAAVRGSQDQAANPAAGAATADEASEDDALPHEVPIRFVLPTSGAHSVTVAGDFNDWRVDKTKLIDPEGDGVFVGTVYLSPGTYSYMFVVDGKRWVTDPYASNFRNDGFGQKNAVLRID